MAITAVLEIASRNIFNDEGILTIDKLLASEIRDAAKERLLEKRGQRISYLCEDFLPLLREKGLMV